MDCSLPGSSVHGIFQARVLEWGAIAFSITRYYRLPKNKMMFLVQISLLAHRNPDSNYLLNISMWMSKKHFNS